MAWTYNPAGLATSDLYQVRFLIGDTDSTDELLSDEEINFLLSLQGSVYGAAITCCDSLSAKFARLVDHSLGPYSVRASKKAEQYATLAKTLKKQATRYCVPTMSSDQYTSIFDKDMMNADVDDHEGSGT